MKFKTEDVGLYFALGLTGAGIGLLVGAFIASRRERRLVIEDVDEEWTDYPVTALKKEEPEKPKRSEIDEEFQRFAATWNPNQVQTQMYLSGLVTLPELEKVMLESQRAALAEPYTYHGLYAPDEKKPDLVDLVPLIEDGQNQDGRFVVIHDVAEGDDMGVDMEIFYDPDTAELYSLSGQGNPITVDRSALISEETWTMVVQHLTMGTNPVLVKDMIDDTMYKFNIVDEDDAH